MKRIIDGLLLIVSLLGGEISGVMLGTIVKGVPNQGGQYSRPVDVVGPAPQHCGSAGCIGAL